MYASRTHYAYTKKSTMKYGAVWHAHFQQTLSYANFQFALKICIFFQYSAFYYWQRKKENKTSSTNLETIWNLRCPSQIRFFNCSSFIWNSFAFSCLVQCSAIVVSLKICIVFLSFSFIVLLIVLLFLLFICRVLFIIHYIRTEKMLIWNFFCDPYFLSLIRFFGYHRH